MPATKAAWSPRRAPQDLLVAMVRGYRLLLKPWLGNACRFEPTCSAYTLQALQQHGALRGSVMGGWRLLRCHPWCDGGHDAVPDTFASPFATPAAGLFSRLVADSAAPADDTAAHPRNPS